MPNYPDDVAAALLRGIGLFLKSTPAPELPGRLRRFRNFRPQALNAHRVELLASLDDDAFRARIAHWLDNDKPSLAKKDAELLGIATSRSDGWEGRLEGAAQPKPAPKTTDQTMERKLEVERDKARKAREEARRAREEGRAALERERERSRGLESQVADLRRQIDAATADAAEARRVSDEAEARLERERRRARTTVDKAKEQVEELRRDLKDARRQTRDVERELKALRDRPAPKRSTKSSRPERAPAKRSVLPVPKGRLEDAPETLEQWLATPDVILVVDGYNVAMAEGAYGDLPLERQRDRVVEELNRLARKNKVRTIVVFDGSKIGPGLARRARGPVEVEYSRPDEIADDHIIARLEGLPPVPVVLATNDRELQTRARVLKATIATSTQLVEVIR
ncbi:MAG TPA: NYN domain-containing protein [Actinomycetota bacterium]|nr:NYN domain-containing protein [Actinomycetota bacterium]